MNLSESEEKFLLKLEKSLRVKRVLIAYIGVGMALCAAIVNLVFGIIWGGEKSFFNALFCTVLGISLFSLTHAYQKMLKMFNIVLKMKEMIKDLEKSYKSKDPNS